MGKASGKHGGKAEGSTGHVVKADVRHRYEVKELVDFSRRMPGVEKLAPRRAVLAPLDGGPHVEAYVPANLAEAPELGCIVMVRPLDRKAKNDSPDVKFRITNVVESARAGVSRSEGEVLSAKQNAQLSEDVYAAVGERRAAKR